MSFYTAWVLTRKAQVEHISSAAARESGRCGRCRGLAAAPGVRQTFPGASVGFSIKGKVPMNLDRASRAVLRVGDGRGFVVAGADESYRYVITAAHCLPWLPPCMSFSKLEECSAYVRHRCASG